MTATEVDWNALVRLEPGLLSLESRIRSLAPLARRRPTWCANAAWYGYGAFADHGALKATLSALVGHHRRPAGDAVLATREAYDAAYDRLYALLPACRRCGCM